MPKNVTTNFVCLGAITMPFNLTDVRIDQTVICGTNTAGFTVVGRVVAVLPGIGFRVRDCDGVETILWNDMFLVKDDEVEFSTVSAPVADSGYGFPDCDFWESQGIEPLFVADAVTSAAASVPAPGCLVPELVAKRDLAEKKGGAYLRAWTRQMTEYLSLLPSRTPGPLLSTPERPLPPSPLIAPGAPARGSSVPSIDLSESEPEPEPEDECDEEDDEDQEEEEEDEDQGEEEDDEDQGEEEDDEDQGEEEDDEDQEEEGDDDEDQEEEGDDDEDQEEEEQEDEVDEQDDGGSKIINFLTSPNTGPIVVLVGWAAYLALLTYQNYCS
jgi:hypothetical protein